MAKKKSVPYKECPKCGSKAIFVEAGLHLGVKLTETIHCHCCGYEWKELYIFNRIIEQEEQE